MFNKGEIIHHTRDALGSILVVDYRKHRVLTFKARLIADFPICQFMSTTGP